MARRRARPATGRWSTSSGSRGSCGAFSRWTGRASHDRQFQPRVSPDGRFLAYSSSESGRTELYLTRFPEPEGKWQVSLNGSEHFQWSADGSRLYFLQDRGTRDRALMEAEVTTEPEVAVGRPRELFFVDTREFAVAADGKSFIVAQRAKEGSSAVMLVPNWFEEFRGQ